MAALAAAVETIGFGVVAREIKRMQLCKQIVLPEELEKKLSFDGWYYTLFFPKVDNLHRCFCSLGHDTKTVQRFKNFKTRKLRFYLVKVHWNFNRMLLFFCHDLLKFNFLEPLQHTGLLLFLFLFKSVLNITQFGAKVCGIILRYQASPWVS